jgi:hypothetical protein
MDFLTKMYTVRKNVCQMLEDRGFLVGEVSTEQLPVCWLHNVLTYACSRWLICVLAFTCACTACRMMPAWT